MGAGFREGSFLLGWVREGKTFSCGGHQEFTLLFCNFAWRAFGVPRFFFAFDEALYILAVSKGDKQSDYAPEQSDGILVG